MDITPVTSHAAIAASPAEFTSVRVGYGASLAADASAFEAALESAGQRAAASEEGSSELARAALEPLDSLDHEARSIGAYASEAVASGNQLTPAEIVNLTVQSQKFMFHSQLTSNIANRTADGVQQLFRQQG